MSRSLARASRFQPFSYEDEGRAMHARGEPCPRNVRTKGKEHALWRGWQRAATAARTKGKK